MQTLSRGKVKIGGLQNLSQLVFHARAQYSFAVDGGAVSTLTPAKTIAFPDNAIILGVFINSTTAVTSAGSATVAIGTSAGSSSTALLGATAKTSFTLDALLAGVPILSDATKWVKLTASGNLTVTIGTAALTAGVIDIFVEYILGNP